METLLKPLSSSPNKSSRLSLPAPTTDGSDLSVSYKTNSEDGLLPAHRLPTPFARTLTEVPSYEKTKKTNKVADYQLKIVVVGDGAVGKTCLLISYTQGKFPTDYVPTIFENYVTKVQGPNNKIIELGLWDTAGQEEYNRLRPLSYTDVDLLMICYSADSKTSLYNVEELWFPEVKHFCPDTPIMIVGLKNDLYAIDNLEKLVDPKDAELLAKKLGAFAHFQCSAKTRNNVDELFGVALTTLLRDTLQKEKVVPFTQKVFGSKKPSLLTLTSKQSKPKPKKARRFCTVL